MLRLMRPDLAADKQDCKVTPDDFLEVLKDYEIYSGPLSEYKNFIDLENEEYFAKVGKIKGLKMQFGFFRRRYLHYHPKDEEDKNRQDK